MAVDTSIIGRLQPFQPAQQDSLGTYSKMLGIQGALGQQDLQALQLKKTREDLADEEAVKQAYQQSAGDPATLRKLLTERGAYKPLQALDKFDLEKREKESTIAKNTAQGAKANWEVEVGHLQHGAALLDMAKDPQSFESVLKIGQLNGTFKPEFVAQMTQHGYSPELVKSLQNAGLTRAQQLEQQHRANTEAQTAATAPFTPSPTPGGAPVPNAPAQAFELAKRAAGKPSVSVNVSTEKKYGEKFAGEMATQDASMLDAARKAPALAQRANEIKQTLAGGKVITGTGAEARLAIGKALGLSGASDAETIANTETLSTQLAANTLAAIKASGLGSGSGFSNADRDFLEKAVGGKINLEATTIDRLATLAHRAADQTAKQWGRRAKEIPADALQGTGVTSEPIAIPPLFTPPSAPGAPPKPGGIKFLGFEGAPGG